MTVSARPEPLLLLIGSQPAECRQITSFVGRAGWRTNLAQNADYVARTASSDSGQDISAIVLDQSVAGDATCELIGELKRHRPDLPIVLLTDSTSPILAVEALRAGASDFLIKPFAADRLLHALRLATSRNTSSTELLSLAEKLDTPVAFDGMIGVHSAFRAALAQAARSARSQEHVLVQGESGTGKDMLIRAMHAASPRAKMAFRVINVRGNTTNALESLLFGHERGAFPGAFETQVGALQECDGGTLVLDDVNRMALPVQVRLAEVLNEGRVRPLGASHSFRIDTRIFAACNEPLAKSVKTRGFDAELCRLLSSTIDLPPLRARAEDIPSLTRYFLRDIRHRTGLPELSVTEEVLSLLASFNWPGNVRQLKAVLFRAAALSRGDALTVLDFPHLLELRVQDEGCGQNAKGREQNGVMLYTDEGHLRKLRDIEADIIRLAIGHYGGRMTQVARKLGVGRSTLYRKLSELGLESSI